MRRMQPYPDETEAEYVQRRLLVALRLLEHGCAGEAIGAYDGAFVRFALSRTLQELRAAVPVLRDAYPEVWEAPDDEC